MIATLMTRVARKAVALGGRVPGFLPAARQARSRQVAIVMYHGITATPLPVANWCQLAVEQFEQQLDYLAHHYTLLPLGEAVRRLAERQPLPRAAAVLTFDDGFRNVFTTAFPLLQRYQAPATVYLVTGLIGTRQPAWPEQLFNAVSQFGGTELQLGGKSWPATTPEERATAYRGLAQQLKTLPQSEKEAWLTEFFGTLGSGRPIPADSPLATLDWSEIESMQRSGLIEFGSHTHTHPILSRCTREQQEAELRQSRDLLRERLGKADHFAYPNGTRADFTRETQQLLAQLDYRSAVSTEIGLNGHGADRYGLRRVNIGADATMPSFRLQMLGV
jgi:peptidoglycan/xylan/chitin deacetylase (PgdA/CDA1 family)